MRDLDQALARAYGGGPSSRRADPSPAAPGPHFAVEPPRDRGGPALSWPPLVLALERAHGERFEALADALVEAHDRRGVGLLLFTGAHRAEGRTTLVLSVARALARRPLRTLLVDADLAGPMLARSLGLAPRVGLDDVVERGAMASEALISAPDDHLTVLPLRLPVSRPRELLRADGWRGLMARLRREFDLVLLDGGPLFSGLLTPPVPPALDAALIVRRASAATDRAEKALDAAGLPVLGVAETFC